MRVCNTRATYFIQVRPTVDSLLFIVDIVFFTSINFVCNVFQGLFPFTLMYLNHSDLYVHTRTPMIPDITTHQSPNCTRNGIFVIINTLAFLRHARAFPPRVIQIFYTLRRRLCCTRVFRTN